MQTTDEVMGCLQFKVICRVIDHIPHCQMSFCIFEVVKQTLQSEDASEVQRRLFRASVFCFRFFKQPQRSHEKVRALADHKNGPFSPLRRRKKKV